MTTYRIESIELLVRRMPPDRMSFAIGAQRVKRRPRAVLIVRLQLKDAAGRSAWGVSGDRPSFGWLDKRGKYGPEKKLSRLLTLVEAARQVWLSQREFATPFAGWLKCHPLIQEAGRRTDHESLSAAYASALIERAVIDAVCRMEGRSFFEAVTDGLLGFQPQALHQSLGELNVANVFPYRPLTTFAIRHTVGLSDPLVAADLADDRRVNDGEPETLEEYVRRDGLRYFKIKVGGQQDVDLDRLDRIWDVISRVPEPVVTLDGNESYTDLQDFEQFVLAFESRLLGMFQHTAFIEQPLPRALTRDRSTSALVRRIAERKPLVIDEADGEVRSFFDAFSIGYDGVSHKNCKGVFKSLANYCLCRHWEQTTGRAPLQSGEDLSNMPLVPIQQDFTVLGTLGITHCERNGHHYGFGLSHLAEAEKAQAVREHPDLYVERAGEVFLRIEDGQVRCRSLQVPGMGVRFEPDWSELTPVADWVPEW